MLFRQTRVGRWGKPFKLVKFRTMRVADPKTRGPEVTADGDARITPVGRILRKTKLDELPTLVNVLVGDLSLVGPRPEVPRYVSRYPDSARDFLQRYRPGVTDPATIAFRNEEDILAAAGDPEQAYLHQILPQKLELYQSYLEEASLLGDFAILGRTFWVILFPDASPRDTEPLGAEETETNSP